MALNSKNVASEFPIEFIEMKFCERFKLTPFEYRAMPKKMVELWTLMASVESAAEKSKLPSE